MVAVRKLLCAAGVLLVSGCLGGVPASSPDKAETEAREGLAAFFARGGSTGGRRAAPLARVNLAGATLSLPDRTGIALTPRRDVQRPNAVSR